MLDVDQIPARVIAMTDSEYNTVEKRLSKEGFKNISWLAGVDGKTVGPSLKSDRSKLSFRAQQEIEFSEYREAHSSLPSWGGIGCYLSHVDAWKEAEKSKTGLLVFEADAKPVPDAAAKFNAIFKAFQEQHHDALPDIFFFGGSGSQRHTTIPKSNALLRLLDRQYGTEGYYVSPAGARKLLQDALPMEVQVDTYIGYKIERDRKKAWDDANAFVALKSKDRLVQQENQEGTKIQTKPVRPGDGGESWMSQVVVILLLCFLALCTALFLLEYYKNYTAKK